MEAHQVVNDLRKLGYNLLLNGEKIKFIFQGEGNPPVEKATSLLLSLKEYKEEVVHLLKKEQPKTITEDRRKTLEMVMDAIMLSITDNIIKSCKGGSFNGESAPSQHPIPVEESTRFRNKPAGDSGAIKQVLVIQRNDLLS